MPFSMVASFLAWNNLGYGFKENVNNGVASLHNNLYITILFFSYFVLHKEAKIFIFSYDHVFQVFFLTFPPTTMKESN